MSRLKINNNPPNDLLFVLTQLVDNACPYPHCMKQSTIVVSCLESKKESTSFENSMVFCPKHALDCENGVVSDRFFMNMRKLLVPNRGRENSSKSSRISSRPEYLSQIATELENTTTLRSIYLGPLPFHPEWYYTMQEGKYKMVSMDRAVFHALYNPEIKVSMILRNTKRYFEKVNDLVPKKLHRSLFNETCKNYKELTKEAYNNIFVFLDTGPFHIPTIFDTACVFAFRSKAFSPISGGMLTRDIAHVNWEKTVFDNLINNNMNKKNGVEELKQYLIDGFKE